MDIQEFISFAGHPLRVLRDFDNAPRKALARPERPGATAGSTPWTVQPDDGLDDQEAAEAVTDYMQQHISRHFYLRDFQNHGRYYTAEVMDLEARRLHSFLIDKQTKSIRPAGVIPGRRWAGGAGIGVR